MFAQSFSMTTVNTAEEKDAPLQISNILLEIIRHAYIAACIPSCCFRTWFAFHYARNVARRRTDDFRGIYDIICVLFDRFSAECMIYKRLL